MTFPCWDDKTRDLVLDTAIDPLKDDDCKWLADIWCGIDWGFDPPAIVLIPSEQLRARREGKF